MCNCLVSYFSGNASRCERIQISGSVVRLLYFGKDKACITTRYGLALLCRIKTIFNGLTGTRLKLDASRRA